MQTGRKLNIRIKEHRNDINKKLEIYQSRNTDYNLNMNLILITILDNERYLGKRLMPEMLNIKLQDKV